MSDIVYYLASVEHAQEASEQNGTGEQSRELLKVSKRGYRTKFFKIVNKDFNWWYEVEYLKYSSSICSEDKRRVYNSPDMFSTCAISQPRGYGHPVFAELDLSWIVVQPIEFRERAKITICYR